MTLAVKSFARHCVRLQLPRLAQHPVRHCARLYGRRRFWTGPAFESAPTARLTNVVPIYLTSVTRGGGPSLMLTDRPSSDVLNSERSPPNGVSGAIGPYRKDSLQSSAEKTCRCEHSLTRAASSGSVGLSSGSMYSHDASKSTSSGVPRGIGIIKEPGEASPTSERRMAV